MTVACDEKLSPAMPVEPPGNPASAPAPGLVTANAYILRDAATLGPLAFGEPPLVVYKGERLRWVNTDGEAHSLVPDSTALPEFVATDVLTAGAERSYIMQTVGTTTFHCTIHPKMVGTLVVLEK
jgi:plastocyanin